MTKSLLLLFLFLAFSISAQTDSTSKAAIDKSLISFQCEFFPSYFVDVTSWAQNYVTRSILIGTRITPTERFGIDIMLGGGYNSGYKEDIAKYTQEFPKAYAAQGRIGLAYRLVGEDEASLWTSIQGGGKYQNQFSNYYNFEKENYEYFSYKVFMPIVSLRLEPTVTIHNRLVFFTAFGLQYVYEPATKEKMQIPKYNLDGSIRDTETRIIEKEDANNSFGLDGFCLGVRFKF